MVDLATIYQILVVVCASVGLCVLGFGAGITSPYSHILVNEFHLSETFFNWIVSANPIGSMVGALLGPKSANLLGRRGSLIVIYIIVITGWIAVATAPNPFILFLGRLLHSLGDGMSNGVTYMYVNEVLMKRYRGLGASCLNLTLNLGFPLAYTAGWLLPWRVSALLPCVLLIPTVIILYVLPESPAFLVNKNRCKEAIIALKKLRKKPDFTEFDMFGSKETTNISLSNSIEKFCSSSNITQFTVVVLLLILFPISGTMSIAYHARKICTDMGIERADLISILTGLVRTFGMLISTFLVHKWGRRMPVLLSSFFVTACSLSLTIILYAKSLGYSIAGCTSCLGYSLVVTMLFYMFAAGLGLSSVHWILMAEWPNMENKVVTISVGSVCFFVSLFGSIHLTTFLQDNFGAAGMFLFFTILCGIYFCICFVFVPETSGQTYEDYLRIFNEKNILQIQKHQDKIENGRLEVERSENMSVNSKENFFGPKESLRARTVSQPQA